MELKLLVLSVMIMVLSESVLVCAAARGLSQQRVLAQDPVFIAQMEKRFAEDKREDGRAAKAFCAAPDFKALKCGWASEAEQKATIKKQCPLCGTLYRGLPEKLPAEVEGVDRYNQYGVELMSLACKGPVVVRSVFKMLQEPKATLQQAQNVGWDGTDCTNSRMVLLDDKPATEGGAASPIIRCELELPSKGGSEVERALKAKETKCWNCGLCSGGKGCPSAAGKWYSDSYTTKATGCDIPEQGYDFHRAAININPKTKILLAKFEVCNDPGCFNAAYEKAKQQAAKPCVKGKCA